MINTALLAIGFTIAIVTIAALFWSVVQPDRRLWPPRSYGLWTPVLVWVPTFMLSGVIVALGILEWSAVPIPTGSRYGLGIPLIILANVAVWYEVGKFGIEQTGGAEGTLRTNGLYRYSRNPQYIADSAMVLGWVILSASPSAALVGAVAIAALLIAPFSEEPWLKQTYGQRYIDYMSKVRRYF